MDTMRKPNQHFKTHEGKELPSVAFIQRGFNDADLAWNQNNKQGKKHESNGKDISSRRKLSNSFSGDFRVRSRNFDEFFVRELNRTAPLDKLESLVPSSPVDPPRFGIDVVGDPMF
jgi:hypothetical protein